MCNRRPRANELRVLPHGTFSFRSVWCSMLEVSVHRGCRPLNCSAAYSGRSGVWQHREGRAVHTDCAGRSLSIIQAKGKLDQRVTSATRPNMVLTGPAEVRGHLGSVLLRWRPALVGIVLRGWRVVVRVGCRGGSRGVESCGLAAAAKLLRRWLALHGAQHTVTSALRCPQQATPEGHGALTLVT